MQTFPDPLRLTLLACFLCSLDRKPGDIEAIMDLFVEDFLNFPTTRELGEDSARFIREEMEHTWGDKHMAILTEQESQAWLLGVSRFAVSFCEF